ncbi:multicopper oxidase domain-containing protein [Lapillicoccus jejuensis]|nr:multicopper oxidase domain-containing protein [Lapillicoccus jejuensis]
MPSRVPSHALPTTPILRRIAAVTGTTLLAATFLQTGTAHGLAAPTTTRAVAAPATSGAASSSTLTSRSARASLTAATTPTSVGKLAPAGCAVTGTTESCDLYASPGSALVGGQTLPIWGFSSTAGAAPTAPGPNLVVTQGDTVTVTLHNAWDAAAPNPQRLDLAFPGLSVGDFADGAGPGRAPVGPGGSVSYTFTATRAGTFLYEAGHADPAGNGARQVAMGLAGALVVLPADEVTTTSYADDTVLVLSEIDPDLAAHPDSFDMRGYSPRYRLINGNTFPEIPAVATNAGSTVRLRYVNAGQRQHPMTLLGATQSTIARDGHPLGFPDAQVTAVLEPGTTTDALVAVPDDGTSTFTLYESGDHLQSDGQTAGAGSTEVAFGGMMTALDTNAPVATGDVVGPKASAVTLTAPTLPPTGRDPVALTATLDDTRTGGAAIQSAEYVLDDPHTIGVGSGTPLTVTDPTAGRTTATGTITPDQLQLLGGGTHTVYVRGEDANGNWGAFAAGTLLVQGSGAATTGAYVSPALTDLQGGTALDATGDATASGGTVTGAEYYLQDDAVGGPTDAQIAAGGTPMSLNRTDAASVRAESADLSAAIAGLGDGDHLAWVRSKDDRGLWGPFTKVPFTVDTKGPTAVGQLMPSPTNGLVSSPGTPGYATVSATVDDTSAGGHRIVDAEAFVDPATKPDPTRYGSGLQLVPDAPTLTSSTESFHGGVPLSQLRALPEGEHHVWVHGKDAAGNWGDLFDSTFQVTKTAPVLGTAAQGLAVPAGNAGAATITATVPQANPNNTVSSTWLGAAEFWWGTTDPGVGKGTPVTGTLSAGVLTLSSLPVSGVAPGSRRLNVRVADLAGNWSNPVGATLAVTAPTLVQEPFSAPLGSAWTRTGSAVTVGNGVLQVSSGSAKAYVTSTASISRSVGTTLTTATATVDVDATGVTRAGWTTILSATGSGGQVFGLQLQRAATGPVQVRTVMTRPGTTAVTGTAVALPSGKATLTLVWRAGPKKATATTPAGLLTLSVDGSGTPASSSTGATSGLAVTGLSLGVVGTPATPGLRQTLRLDNLLLTP